MKIDSHQHFWHYDAVKDAWITDQMQVLKNNFYPPDVWPLMQANGIDGCVAVQADQSEQETHFLLDLAEKNDWIKGVVGWVDLRADNIEERLVYFSQFKKLKGFRHIVQAEPKVDFLLQEDFCRGLALLSNYSFTYDILIFPRHLKNALKLVEKFPRQKFIIDHLAKPFIKAGKIDEWKKELAPFAAHTQVYCKIAGLVTEADWQHWTLGDFAPYVEAVLDIFGTGRVVFGTDWPVCLTGASYAQVCEIMKSAGSFLGDADRAGLWGENCARFYNL